MTRCHMTFSTLADKEQGAAKWPACTCTVAYTQNILVRVPGLWRNRADAATRQRQPGQISSSFGADFARLGMDLVAVCHLTIPRRAVSSSGLVGGLACWPSRRELVSLPTWKRPCTCVRSMGLDGPVRPRSRQELPKDESRAPRSSLQRLSSKPAAIPYGVRTYAASKPLVPAQSSSSARGRRSQLLRDKSPAALLLWPSSLSLPRPEAPCRNRRCADRMQILRVPKDHSPPTRRPYMQQVASAALA